MTQTLPGTEPLGWKLAFIRYSEIKDYTFGKEPSRGGPVTGHFTQVNLNLKIFMMLKTFSWLWFITIMIIQMIWLKVVWKGSTEVGVGVAQEGSKVVLLLFFLSTIYPFFRLFVKFLWILQFFYNLVKFRIIFLFGLFSFFGLVCWILDDFVLLNALVQNSMTKAQCWMVLIVFSTRLNFWCIEIFWLIYL